MKRVRGLSPAVPKTFYGLVLIVGIVLYVGWTALYLAPEGKYFDVGLFSLSIILILFGLTGYVLYGEIERRRG